MKKKLLNKTLRAYALFSVLILMVSAPLFYFLADKLFIDDADEALILREREFRTNNLPHLKASDVSLWNTFNRDMKIEEPRSGLRGDSIFYHFYIDSLANEIEPYRVLLAPVFIEGEPHALMVRINLVESSDMIESIAVLFCVILSALLIGLYLITRRLSKRIWRPFYNTLGQVEQFELDKNTKPDFSETDVEEFGRLNQSIGKLLDRNVEVYRNQKEFIENAAHELQTPLAAFRVRLDSLAQKIAFDEDLSQSLAGINEAASKLVKINRNLLLLSKIGNNQFAAFEQVSISQVLRKQVEFLQEQAEGGYVSVEVGIIEDLTGRANATLLEITIGNLLINALRYNKENGSIGLTLRDRKLTVTNTSASGGLDGSRVFERFSAPRSGGGNGLGLAIVKAISTMHGWQPHYEFADDRHVFSISF